MDVVDLIILITFTVIVISMVWARIFFFKVESQASKMISYINDPAVFMQIGGFYYLFFQAESYFYDWRLAEFFYAIGLGLFYWAIVTAKSLSFAGGDNANRLVTSGPYGLVRHPCYLSYLLFWIGNCVLFSTPVIWVSFVVLFFVYVYSASNEEAQIQSGILRKEYEVYKSKVGRFFPKLL